MLMHVLKAAERMQRGMQKQVRNIVQKQVHVVMQKGWPRVCKCKHGFTWFFCSNRL